VLTQPQLINIVEDDVLKGIGKIFAPRPGTGGGFALLDVGGFTFTDKDIPVGQGVTAVAWQYNAVNQRPMIAMPGIGADDAPIPVLQPDPPTSIGVAPHSTGIRETQRNVTIAGVTLVVARTEADEANPTLLRFVDWADVYSQMGLRFDPRVPEVIADPGFQRIQQVT
jgi:hypothetical protein